MFLAAQADAGVAYATISRRAGAIHFRHASAQVESPTRSMLVTAALEGVRRELGVAPARKAPATAQRLVEMVRLCPATLQGQRDRALLLPGFAGAFRRSELAAQQVEDLEVLPQGLRVTIRRSKTDQEDAGQVIAIALGDVHCPVAAVQEWLATAGITAGPVLRRVGKGGRVSREALSDRSVAAIVQGLRRARGLRRTGLQRHVLVLAPVVKLRPMGPNAPDTPSEAGGVWRNWLIAHVHRRHERAPAPRRYPSR